MKYKSVTSENSGVADQYALLRSPAASVAWVDSCGLIWFACLFSAESAAFWFFKIIYVSAFLLGFWQKTEFYNSVFIMGN